MIGAIVVPSRAKKLNRPICSVSPSVSCAISVCDPDQPNDSAPPLTICNSISGQNDGTSGNTGASTIAAQTKNSVTRRVPNRSINTPTWIDRNTGSRCRAPASNPTSPALMPNDSA